MRIININNNFQLMGDACLEEAAMAATAECSPVTEKTPRWVRRNEVPSYAHVHIKTVARWIASGLLPAHQVGTGITLVDLNDVDALILGHRAEVCAADSEVAR